MKNKKIGILTQPLINNYGGILQAYALTTVLSEMGYQPQVIDRKLDARYISNIKKLVKIFIKKYLLRRMNPDIFKLEDMISQNTLSFIKDNIPLTSTIYLSNNIMDINNEKYDAIIVGSDQVWRPIYSPCIRNYFLDFCQNNNTLKKISYAASFGVSDWEFSSDDTVECAKLIKLFDAVSVREDSAVTLCEKFLGVDAELVLDPTLLLTKQDYINLIMKYNEPKSEGELMSYVLDKSEHKVDIINMISQKIQLDLFSVMPQKTLKEKFSMDEFSEFEFPNLTKWLKGFLDAKFVITDSFHGCVFAIIFNVPFIAIGNKDRGLARFVSLLKIFNLESRLIFSPIDISDELLQFEFDWDSINKKRDEKKQLSLDFLQRVLN